MASPRKHRFLKFMAKLPYNLVATKPGRITLYTGAVLGGGVYAARRFREHVTQRWEDPLKYAIYKQGREIQQAQQAQQPSARRRGFQRRYPTSPNTPMY